MQFSNHIDHHHQNNINNNNNDTNFNNNINHSSETTHNSNSNSSNSSNFNSNNPYQYKDEEGILHELNQNEIREVAYTRAAARFGRLFLRDPTTLVDRKLLRQLVTAVRTTAGMGHRSSIVLWGPPQGGKRSTLEALAQIFCVTVEHRAAAAATAASNNNGNNNNVSGQQQQQQQQNKSNHNHNNTNNNNNNNNVSINNAASSSGLMINIHRHPQNSSSTVGGSSGSGGSGSGSSGTTNTSGKISNNQQLATNAKGIPILGVVLDGTALRSDHDAAQQCLNALYDFWWLAASVRNREMKKFGDAGAAAAAAALQLRHQQQRMRQENQAKAAAAAAAAAAKRKNISGTTAKTIERQTSPPAAQRINEVNSKKQILSATKMSKKKALLANLLKKNKRDSSDEDEDDEDGDSSSEEEESSTSEDEAPKKKIATKKDKNNKTPTEKKTRRGRPAGSSIKKPGRKLATEKEGENKNTKRESSPKKPVVGKKVAKNETIKSTNKAHQQQQQVFTSTNNNTSNNNNNIHNPILGGVPFWCIQADELLNWLFTEALPESMHKQAPPTSTAAATSNNYNNFMSQNANNNNSENNNQNFNNSNSSMNQNNNSRNSGATTTHHNNIHSGNDMNYLIAAHHHNAFRSAIQQTFRVFTHGGNTVLTALQTSLLELSKCGVSPCFLIHDIRMLGQTCDKILYMISGLLHEQEILANITTTPAAEGSNSNNNNNNKNNNKNNSSSSSSTNPASDPSSFSMTSMMNANIPGLLISAQNNNQVQNQQQHSSFFVGGGMSIVMTSPNPDLRLEKRLSSRMNCDYYFCPQIIPNFVTCLAWSFRPLHENVEQNEALHFTQQWAIEDASVRPVRNPLPATNNNIKTSSEQNNNNENHLPIASLVVPTNANNNNNNFEKPSSGNNNISNNNNNPNQNQQPQQTLQQQQFLLARRRLRAGEDPRQLFMAAVMELEDDIGEMLLNEITHPVTGARVMHPLRGMYLDFSLKCEQLSRPAHIIRRLMETWFELAIESCHFFLPSSTNNSSEKSQQVARGVDIFSDPKYFITGDMLERACFGYSESLTLQDSSNHNSNKTGTSNLLYSFGRTASNAAPTTNLDTNPASASATSNFHVYYTNSLISNSPMVSCSQATAGPLRPLAAFSLNGPSSSMPRECVSLLTCLISGILQQRRGAMNAQIRTLQDHYTMFQELRGGGGGTGGVATTTTTTTTTTNSTSGSMNKNQNNLTLSSSSSASASASNTDSIDSWLKAAALLRRWGIIRAWSSGVMNSNSGNNNNNNNNTSSQQGGNIAVSITATSKLDLEIENVEALIKLVQSSISVVFDNATAQNIKALLR